MFHLVTSYYYTPKIKRQQELNLSLKKNVENKYIEKIYLLNDKIYDLPFLTENEKQNIIQIKVDDKNALRLGYDYAISFINNNLSGKKCILSNSDIYFDDTLQHLIEYNLENVFCGLSRYDNDILFDRKDSQDSWIFISPLRVDLVRCRFKFGHPGCDNKLAYIAKKANYTLINPSKTIKIHHLHNSKVRNYTKEHHVHGPYEYILPSTL